MQTPFNPLVDLQTAEDLRPEDLSPVNLRALAPFQRALLVIDGTVTKFIEAYQLEPVVTQRLQHLQVRTDGGSGLLEAPQGSLVLRRSVELIGAMSRRSYALATANVLLESLPENIRLELESEQSSLGRVLNQAGWESRREILWFGKGHPRQPNGFPEETTDRDFLIRCYKIVARQRPVALITEHFPSRIEHDPTRE